MPVGWLARACGVGLLLTVLCSGAGWAAETAGAVKALPIQAKRWALVIGVDRYSDSQITALGGSSNDAKSIAEALVRHAGFPSEQVILLSSNEPAERQPTRGNILHRLSNLRAAVPRDGLLFLSFAGHGIERKQHAFLLPSDAQVSDDIELLEETAINVDQIKRSIRETGVSQVILVLDACRNDPVAARGDVPNPLTSAYLRGFSFDVRNREVSAFATLYATAIGQRAYEYSEKHQGYFTWELVQGLSGGAANDRGEVTLAGLVDYVQKQVPKHVLTDLGAGREQRPFAEIEGYEADQLVVAVASRGIAVTPAAPPAPSAAIAGAASTSSALPRSDPAAFEITYWETIKDSKDPEDFKSYLAKYPNGQFADLARRRSQLRTASTGVTPPTAPAPATAVQNGGQRSLILSNVYSLGVSLGFAEVGSYQNTPTVQLQPYLDTARASAVTAGLATDRIDLVLNQLRGGATSQSQYPTVLAERQTLEQAFDRIVNCGRPINLRNVLVLGAEQGFMEVIAYQNGDRASMSQILGLAIQYAGASGLSTSELQSILGQVSLGRSTRDQYQPLQNERAKQIQATYLSCTW